MLVNEKNKKTILYLKQENYFHHSLQQYIFHQIFHGKAHRAKSQFSRETMKQARTTILGQQSEHSTPPASLACKDPSPTPCLDIIDAKITSIVGPHPIMAPLTNPKTKPEFSGRRRVKNVSLATKKRTNSKNSDTWQRN